MAFSKALKSRKSNEWITPKWIFAQLDEIFHFTLDPAATKENAKCAKFYTKEDDGLAKSWKDETVFVNPPYSKVADWVRKAHHESQNGACQVVMLIPARTDTRCWHQHIFTSAAEIFFVKGRIKFDQPVQDEGKQNGAPFPSAVIVFNSSASDQIFNTIVFNKKEH